MKDLAVLEARWLTVRQELEKFSDEQPLRLHSSLSKIYRKKVAELTQALNVDETSCLAATEALHDLLSTLRLTPDDGG